MSEQNVQRAPGSDHRRSHWVVKALPGSTVDGNPQITEDEPDR
jgi:uncharacterized membrane protein